MTDRPTTDRPTPDKLAMDADTLYRNTPLSYAASKLLDDLAAEGYVIVHPDDVPDGMKVGLHEYNAYSEGWDACRDHIFGDDR